MVAAHDKRYGLRLMMAAVLGSGLIFSGGTAVAAAIEVFHADSLAGPMKALKAAYEAGHPDVRVNLTTGRSQELAERILKGDRCDVFAVCPSRHR